MSLLASSSSSALLRQLYRQPPRLAHCFSHSARAARTARAPRTAARGERLVLGIETSCDDSCVALLRAPADYGASLAKGEPLPPYGGAHVVASVVLRQDHSATGGIEPLVAAHEHAARLPSALLQVLAQAREAGALAGDASQVPSEIDAIAVTQGPGMAGCLSSGLAMAKTLSALWDRPLLYVHHMAAHALSPFLTSLSLRFPYLCLLLSGGHSQLVLVRGLDDYEILADATDGAIGNAFDKVARWLDAIDQWASEPPGRQLEKLALRYTEQKRSGTEAPEALPPLTRKLPVPFKGVPAFSFGGLKEAVSSEIRHAQASGHCTPAWRSFMAYEFQEAAFAQLRNKLKMALEPETARSRIVPHHLGAGHQKEKQTTQTPRIHILDRRLDLGMPRSDIRHVVVAGGVASNQALRSVLRAALDSMNRHEVDLIFPPVELCTDNAAMIAHAGLLAWEQRTRDMHRFPRAKWSLAQLRAEAQRRKQEAEQPAAEAQETPEEEASVQRKLKVFDIGL